MKSVIHKGFELGGAIERVELLYGLKSSGVKFIAACAEDILDQVAVLEGIVDGVIIALRISQSKSNENAKCKDDPR